jgi:hypothetical protein
VLRGVAADLLGSRLKGRDKRLEDGVKHTDRIAERTTDRSNQLSAQLVDRRQRSQTGHSVCPDQVSVQEATTHAQYA